MIPRRPYVVLLHDEARKDLDRLSVEDLARVEVRLRMLGREPRPRGATKITKRLRVRQGRWRIFFAVNDTDFEVTVHRVLARNERTYQGW